MGPYQIDFTVVQYVNRQVQPSGRASIEPVTRIKRVQRIRPRREEWLEEEQEKTPVAMSTGAYKVSLGNGTSHRRSMFHFRVHT